jgi:adenosylcobinamide-GDP ribazoletransferase
MRDPGIGAYGALALIAYALLALTALSGLSASQAASALICGHTLGRWSTLPQLAWIEPAREDGLGASLQAAPATLAIGSACAGVIAIVSCGLVAGAAAIAAAALATAAVALVAWRFVGGRSGDTLGASALLVEVIVYSVLAAYWLA